LVFPATPIAAGRECSRPSRKSGHATEGPAEGCAYRKSTPAILVMQSAQDRTADNSSGCLGGT